MVSLWEDESITENGLVYQWFSQGSSLSNVDHPKYSIFEWSTREQVDFDKNSSDEDALEMEHTQRDQYLNGI